MLAAPRPRRRGGRPGLTDAGDAGGRDAQNPPAAARPAASFSSPLRVCRRCAVGRRNEAEFPPIPRCRGVHDASVDGLAQAATKRHPLTREPAGSGHPTVRHERVDAATAAVVIRGRAVTPVLVVVETEALAEPARSVLEAGGFEVTVATQPAFPSALRPRAVVVVTEELVEPWFSAVVDRLRSRGWGRRTVVVAPLTRQNWETVRMRGLGVLYPLAGLEAGFADALARLAVRPSWAERASRRMQALLGVTDDLCARFVEEAFMDGPAAPSIGELCRTRLFTSPRNLRSRWQTQHLPGSPKQVLDRIVALRFAKLRGRGLGVVAACGALSLHRTTMQRLTRRAAGVTPGVVDEDGLWAAIDDWVDGTRRVS